MEPESVKVNVRSGAAGTLGVLGRNWPEDIRPMVDPEASDASVSTTETPLLDAVTNEDEYVRESAVKAVSQLAVTDTDLIPLVKSKLQEALDDNDHVECAAVEAVGIVGAEHPESVEDLIPALVTRLGHRANYIRAAAAESLGAIVASAPSKVDEVEGPLTDAIHDHNATVRAEACQALAAIGGTDAAPHLEELLTDPDQDVQEAAEEALETLDQPSSRSQSQEVVDEETEQNLTTGKSSESADVDGAPSTTTSDERDYITETAGQSATERTEDWAEDGPASSGDISIAAEDETLSVPDFDVDYDTFEVQNRIGRGMNAEVYKATLQVGDERHTVALKEPIIDGTISTDHIESFSDEAKVWGRLSGRDHVVGVIDWGRQPMPWMAAEYMDGGALDEYIGEITVPQALVVTEQLASAVRHDRTGVVHLDLKPSNVLFTTLEDGSLVPKVADWGLARFLSEQGGTIDGVSTRYAAPEQFDPEMYGEPDSRTDIYQLGVILYELLTGSPPFTGSDARVLKATLDDEPKLPSDVVDIPPSLDDLVLTALAKDQSDRYATMERFQAAIQESLESLG